jgi:hypothetical protein
MFAMSYGNRGHGWSVDSPIMCFNRHGSRPWGSRWYTSGLRIWTIIFGARGLQPFRFVFETRPGEPPSRARQRLMDEAREAAHNLRAADIPESMSLPKGSPRKDQEDNVRRGASWLYGQLICGARPLCSAKIPSSSLWTSLLPTTIIAKNDHSSQRDLGDDSSHALDPTFRTEALICMNIHL